MANNLLHGLIAILQLLALIVIGLSEFNIVDISRTIIHIDGVFILAMLLSKSGAHYFLDF